MKKLNIKGIIFDYGGTLDTKGDHWSEALWKAYLRFGLGVGEGKECEAVGSAPSGASAIAGKSIHKQAFRDAYVYAERALAVNPIVKPKFHFVDILREKFILELSYLAGLPLLPTGKDDAEKQATWKNEQDKQRAERERGGEARKNLFGVEESVDAFLNLDEAQVRALAQDMANYTDEVTNALLQKNRAVLEHLHEAHIPMVLVSNFYGNINQVLKDAGLKGYFKQVIESAVVGVRKPNPAIFALGVCALDLPASQVLVVGDTYGKDIVPAHQLGCHTLWIKGLQWEDKECDESLPDGIIENLSEMESYVL